MVLFIFVLVRMQINLFGKSSVFEQTSGEFEDESNADIPTILISARDSKPASNNALLRNEQT